MGNLLIIKNADFSVNAIDTQPIPVAGAWVVGYKALYNKYLALSGLSEQGFVNTYCNINTQLSSNHYFIDKNQECSGKTVTRIFIIGYCTENAALTYGICDGIDANRNVINPAEVGSIELPKDEFVGEVILSSPFEVASNKYLYWRVSQQITNFAQLDAQKLAAYNPTDLTSLDKMATFVTNWPADKIYPQPDFFIK